MKPLLIFRFLIHLRLHCACIEKTNICLGYGLDVVRFTDIVIPEPAHYAALFGLCALLFALRRRRMKK